jgi:hypothetical protein
MMGALALALVLSPWPPKLTMRFGSQHSASSVSLEKDTYCYLDKIDESMSRVELYALYIASFMVAYKYTSQ